MKKILMVLALASSFHAISGTTIVEYDEAQEIKCNGEAKTLGCLNGAGEEDSNCVEAKKVKLSKDCQSMHASKRKNK